MECGKFFSNEETFYGNIVGDVVGDLTGNVVGNVTGNVTGSSSIINSSEGTAGITSTSFTSGSITLGTNLSDYTLIPLNATEGLVIMNIDVLVPSASSPIAPWTITFNLPKLPAEGVYFNIVSYNASSANPRNIPVKLNTGSATSASIPGLYGIAFTSASFFAGHLEYKCTL
jgi:hypothetical protein